MEIKVGEYIRTKTGYIDKIKGIDTAFDNTKYYILDDDYIMFRTQIIKHSKNIIDLIEVGDYIELQHEDNLGKSQHFIDNEFSLTLLKEDLIKFKRLKIKSVITHEQIESIKYEV